MATKGNLGEVVTTCERSWVQASPWGFPSGAKNEEIGDDLAWVASGPERQQVAVAGAFEAAKDAPTVDEGAQADPAPMQAPQPSPPPPPAVGRIMPHRLGRLKEEMHGLQKDIRSLHGLVKRSMTDQGRFST
uniref:Uncharacterized protein n=1 Tax=Tanacetum cinerariifolium TaxID=118510 RepID=A0A699GHJ8_TANCI|nr:hypothetical protein [Tanacetum cinerariifolium]